jgi:hypothetical protein
MANIAHVNRDFGKLTNSYGAQLTPAERGALSQRFTDVSNQMQDFQNEGYAILYHFLVVSGDAVCNVANPLPNAPIPTVAAVSAAMVANNLDRWDTTHGRFRVQSLFADLLRMGHGLVSSKSFLF